MSVDFRCAALPGFVSMLIALQAGAIMAASSPTGSDDFKGTVQPFIDQHCLSCHGEKKAKAGFRIDQLSHDFSAAKAADQWKEVIDRINSGEMPPEEKTRPDTKQAAAFVSWVNGQLREVELAAKNAGGRIPMRRLNRDEYANTIRDLLHLDEQLVRPLVEELPGDGKAEGFDRLGVALFFDQTQIERSMAVAEKIAAKAIVTDAPKVNRKIDTFGELRRRPPAAMIEVFPSATHMVPRGAEDRFVRPEYIEFIQGGPTYKREYDGWGAINHFSISQVVTQDGYYRIRIKAKVDNRSRTTPNKFRLQYGMDSPIQMEKEVEVDPSGTTETIVFLRGGVGDEVKGPQVFRLLWNHTEKAVIPEPSYIKTFFERTGFSSKRERAAANKAPQSELDGYRKQLDEVIAKLNSWEGPAHIYNPEMDIEKLPRLQIASIEIEGPVQKEWPPASHKALMFDGDTRGDAAYAREIFVRFLPRAYRRPVTSEEVDEIVAVVTKAKTVDKMSFPESMRIGLQRVLCAPGFLFLEEPAGQHPQRRPLTDYELASRLSYFLWSSMPDEELFKLAAANKLHDPATVNVQVSRMLADIKCDQFVKNFAGQWLSVRDYGSVQPAADYKDYDKPLEAASKLEPFAFFTEVLNKNLPITCFVDSDFIVVNQRLAKHYQVEEEFHQSPQEDQTIRQSDNQSSTIPRSSLRLPDGFQAIKLPSNSHRGGVLGMTGLMTYLADGTRTLPMRRGSWVLRELFNDPPNNPPPNAGEIQPNTAGKSLTVRERLELHRKDEICASCHFKLDPYGLALENYDAIGQWREKFNGEGIRSSKAPTLDVSGKFPDGKTFSNLEEYKAGLMAQKDKFARAFSVKMLTYALGRPVGYADHEVIEALTDSLKKNQYQIQTLIQGIAASEPFRTK